MTSQFLAAVAVVGLFGAGVARAGATRSFEAMTGPAAMLGSTEGGGKCRIDAIPTGQAEAVVATMPRACGNAEAPVEESSGVGTGAMAGMLLGLGALVAVTAAGGSDSAG